MHGPPRATPLILAGLFVLICACKREPEVKDIAESGWTLDVETPPPAAASLDRLTDLAAAGWTITPSSLSEAEQVLGPDDQEWIRFKSTFEQGDRVVRLVAPGHQWANSAGWDGYAIVRDDKVIAELVVLLS